MEDRHAYIRIADELRTRITSGELVEGDRLPSIPDLRRTYGVAGNTAAAAIRALVNEGLVVSRSGAGTFVRRRPELQRLVRCWDRARRPGSPFFAEMEAQGRQGSWDYDSRTMLAPPEIRERLGLGDPPADGRPDVMRTEYVFRADGEPAMLSTSWEPRRLTEGSPIFMPEEGTYGGRGVVDRMIAIGVQIDGTDEIVGARLGTAEECARLQIPAGSVVMTIRRSYPAGEQIVETADIVLPAELFELVYSWRIDAG